VLICVPKGTETNMGGRAGNSWCQDSGSLSAHERVVMPRRLEGGRNRQHLSVRAKSSTNFSVGGGSHARHIQLSREGRLSGKGSFGGGYSEKFQRQDARPRWTLETLDLGGKVTIYEVKVRVVFKEPGFKKQRDLVR